ncbi:carbonic anhydrase [Gracilibacillus boraciitolerans JCM 21714]|uniref:carbonic anhydrase n=1 Tax=Gracilibacillus boraciitolerans JCM 21714 TaxID=1298598 RepID=W4VJH8_9BACI|nr:carbonic anhydrase [Gracilibacillus boraciitolerans]GAE93372.1 carbonic anhydrase [Gracilibacillus boraciitolerans JCM 21714]
MLLDEILEYNKQFVEDESYQKYETDKFPNKRAVIFTCMDTRLVELLPKALNISNGDVKMVKNAGAILNDPYDSTMKSILVAIHALQAEEVFVIAHHGCGMNGFNTDDFVDLMKEHGIEQTEINSLDKDPKEWLTGFDDVKANVEQSVRIIDNHPLLPEDIPVHGLIIDPATGKLDLVKKGY